VLAEFRHMRRHISPPSPESEVCKVTPAVPEQSTPAPVLPWHPASQPATPAASAVARSTGSRLGSRLAVTSIRRRGTWLWFCFSRRLARLGRPLPVLREKPTRGAAAAEGES
jgi:hypothetical protein